MIACKNPNRILKKSIKFKNIALTVKYLRSLPVKRGQTFIFSFLSNPFRFLVGPIGPTRNLKGLLKKENINVWPLFTGRLRRYLTVKAIFLNFIDFFKILFGFLQAIIYLIIYRPNIIFSKGGYGSFPTIVWAWIFRIPTIAHESDSI